MKSIFKKSLSGFIPASSEAESLMKKIKLNELVTIDVKKPRSLQNHRRYFALLKLVLSNQEEYKSIDDLLEVIKIKLKLYDVKHTLEGKPYPQLHSINFASMKELDFQKVFTDTLNILSEFLGVTTDELESEIINFY